MNWVGAGVTACGTKSKVEGAVARPQNNAVARRAVGLAIFAVIASIAVAAQAQTTATLSGGSLTLGNNSGGTDFRVYLAGTDGNHYIYSTGSTGNRMYFGEYTGSFHFVDTSSNTEVMTIQGNSVGVGAPNPLFSLDVAGKIHSSTGYVFPDGSTQTVAYNPNAPLSLNGRLSINASGSDSDSTATFLINDTEAPSNGWMIPSAMVSLGAVAGTNVIQNLCAADFNQNDCAYMGIYYAGDQSASNYLTLGMTGHDHLLNLLPSGAVGIGTTSPQALLDVNGGVRISGSGAGLTFPDGTVQATAYTGTCVATGGDYAESVDVSGERADYEPGDVLVIGSDMHSDIQKSTEAYSTLVSGIYSTKPGYVGRRQQLSPKLASGEVPMAMVGIVPTKVSAENGPIHRGDLLVSASLPGYAMKGTDRSRMVGSVLGKAMGTLESGTGMVEVLVSLQ